MIFKYDDIDQYEKEEGRKDHKNPNIKDISIKDIKKKKKRVFIYSI